MGRKMSLNTITVIVGLVFWGFIWGLTGMILSVPLFVIVRIIFEHIPSLSFIGRLMGSSKESQQKVDEAMIKV
jgi:predicted PurR-regulated permease PerM